MTQRYDSLNPEHRAIAADALRIVLTECADKGFRPSEVAHYAFGRLAAATEHETACRDAIERVERNRGPV